MYSIQDELCDYVKNLYHDLIISIIKSTEFQELFLKYKNKQKENCNDNSGLLEKIINSISRKNTKYYEKKINKYYCKLIKYIDYNLIYDTTNEIEPIICISNEVRNKYLELFKYLILNKKFYKLFIKYSKCPDEDNERKLINFINGKINCIKIDCCKCKKDYLPKTIALFELTYGSFITNIVNTMNYYWETYPQEFKRFPIVDSSGTMDYLIKLLDKYYNLGYRYFLGFTRSTTLSEVLDWFNSHPDAIGISPGSTASILKIPKNIFRVNTSSDLIIDAILPQLELSRNIYYLYLENELAALDYIEILKKYPEVFNKLILYPVKSDGSNLTVDDLEKLFANSIQEDCTLLDLFNLTNSYIQLYNNGLNFPGQQYDILSVSATITGEAAIKLNDKYNSVSYKGSSTSIIWRIGYFKLGEAEYYILILNSFNLINSLVTKQNVQNINSHLGILQFDPVTKDLLYSAILVQKFKNNEYVTFYLFVDDPYLGKYQALFENPTIIEEPRLTPILTIGKAIALLELTNSPSDIDQVLNDSIYFYWYNDLTLPRFPIINTEASIQKTIELLDKYYNEGYRIFLGFSRSTVVKSVLEWFKNHPDATGISVVSRASNLALEKNIFRLDYPQNLVIETLLPIFEQTPTLYYIYTEDELVALDYLEILSNDPNINLKTLPIKRDSSNLTVDVISNFLSGSGPLDTILLVLFFNQQTYFDLYNQGLFFGGNQYYIIGALPTITGIARDILNNKLINIQSVFPNTSLLWRKNTDYLTAKYKQIQSSFGLINGLKMIQYILENKSISLLGSHLGILEFDKNNDLKYESFLTLLYKKDVNRFVKFQLKFNDPLLGKFVADFIS
jgi:hypothetical protein